MLSELDLDFSLGRIYLSPRLSATGRDSWPGLLQDALTEGDDASLAQQLRFQRRLNDLERRTRNGRAFSASVPRNAADTLAEGEFNRHYIRAICRLAGEGQ